MIPVENRCTAEEIEMMVEELDKAFTEYFANEEIEDGFTKVNGQVVNPKDYLISIYPADGFYKIFKEVDFKSIKDMCDCCAATKALGKNGISLGSETYLDTLSRFFDMYEVHRILKEEC